MLQGNSGTFKNKGTSLWNFAPNAGLRKFRHGISVVEACYQLSSRNQAGFGHGSFLPLLSSKITALRCRNLSKYPDLENFASAYRKKAGRSERDELDRRRPTELTIPPSSDARPLVYRRDRQALSTARCCRAGQLADSRDRQAMSTARFCRSGQLATAHTCAA